MRDEIQAPWIGLCREEWDERCRIYKDDDEEVEVEEEEQVKDSAISEKLRELWDSYSSIHNRLLEAASDIEMYGICGSDEKSKIEEIRNDCKNIALVLDKLLKGEL